MADHRVKFELKELPSSSWQVYRTVYCDRLGIEATESLATFEDKKEAQAYIKIRKKVANLSEAVK